MGVDIQRADLWKRISALLFDIILIACIATGVAAGLSWALGYQKYADTVDTVMAEIEEKYKAIDPEFDISLNAEEIENLPEDKKQLYADADAEYGANADVQYAYAMMLNLAMIVISFSLIISYAIWELAIPIWLKEGRTLGKKIFGLAVVRTNCVRMKGQAHFIRSMIGKCVLETMVPVYLILMILFGLLDIVGVIVLVLLAALQLFAVFSTRTRSTIHDLISDTVVVDMSSQMVFDTEEELLAYKTKLHAEKAERDDRY